MRVAYDRAVFGGALKEVQTMKRQISILAGVLMALLIILIIVRVKDYDANKIQKRDLFSFHQDDVTSFQVDHFTTGILFKKFGDEWKIKRVETELSEELKKETNNGPGETDEDFVSANSVEVAKVLTYLCHIKVGEPIAKQNSETNLYQINKHSLHVIFLDRNDQELDRLYIGKQGPEMFTSFIKKSDSDFVYLTEQNYRLMLMREYNEWLPTKATETEPEKKKK